MIKYQTSSESQSVAERTQYLNLLEEELNKPPTPIDGFTNSDDIQKIEDIRKFLKEVGYTLCEDDLLYLSFSGNSIQEISEIIDVSVETLSQPEWIKFIIRGSTLRRHIIRSRQNLSLLKGSHTMSTFLGKAELKQAVTEHENKSSINIVIGFDRHASSRQLRDDRLIIEHESE